MGWLLFDHAPDFWAWAGMLIIVLWGLGTAWLNMRESQSVAVPTALSGREKAVQ